METLRRRIGDFQGWRRRVQTWASKVPSHTHTFPALDRAHLGRHAARPEPRHYHQPIARAKAPIHSKVGRNEFSGQIRQFGL
ncbi:uncharacterized protein K489DRAFT_70692 [Dissoconium aciculare CBS 342.82]|uniref:Uncharacterized protein n=1 Tax=Dissoconium aciculare CBS 342.82 TaxID=1314786 RepID=A0A6J3LWG1_9PEZI|nr:uncharacterized protein K489DRAFT_70692 [Dissoconium aciculare CBS 342.82]KAF1819614.1 hypothetical protein K489DRAFT_70692 [Dissoconium aciculare CBS 342.82]